LKKVEVVHASKVEVKPFVISDYVHAHAEVPEGQKVSKKALKHLAKENGLIYSDETLSFAKKLLEAYLAKR